MINMYSIFDKKAGVYHQPAYSLTKEVFIRDLRSFLRERNNQLAQYPEDYDVYFVGVFDEQRGTVDGTVPSKVISIEDIIRMDNEVKENEDV